MSEFTPNVAPKTRDIVYISGLIITAGTGLAVTTVAVVFPDYATQASLIGNAILTSAGVIATGLGVVYRPGAQQNAVG